MLRKAFDKPAYMGKDILTLRGRQNGECFALLSLGQIQMSNDIAQQLSQQSIMSVKNDQSLG